MPRVSGGSVLSSQGEPPVADFYASLVIIVDKLNSIGCSRKLVMLNLRSNMEEKIGVDTTLTFDP